jgi:hypothetical protein
MSGSLQRLLRELEAFGQENDRTVAERPRRMLNINRATGEFLSLLVRAASWSWTTQPRTRRRWRRSSR